MAEYKPLFVYLEPASIPQVVAHIQKYLAENPIVSDPEAIAEAIQNYIEEHPEIIAVASVNGKTGNVVLTGSDIMINPSSAVSVETQLLNLASMINNTGADITQIQANISQIYTTIGTIQTDVETNASNISALQTSVEGQGTRLAAAETDIDNLEAAQTAQGTRLNTAEGNISSLQTRMMQAETEIDNNESGIETLNNKTQNINLQIQLMKNASLKLARCQIKNLTTIPANSSIDLEFDISNLPTGYVIDGVFHGYGGSTAVILINAFSLSSQTPKVTLRNVLGSSVTMSSYCYVYVLYHIGE